MYNIAFYDWLAGGYMTLPPQFAIWVAAVVGGFLGFKSGEI
ncbi:MAG: hypothetical protein ACTSSE_14110 [Candidatus Thorarchaeota archaeon]